MRTILFIIQKEFLQIFRNRTMLPIIFVLPVVQLIILVNAATLEMKSIEMVMVDKDLSDMSRGLTGKFDGSPFFNLVPGTFSLEQAENMMKENKCDMILHIPAGFEKKMVRENNSSIQVLINAINGTVAGISNYYAMGIISSYNRNLIASWYKVQTDEHLQPTINIIPEYWYNPELDYKTFMVPAVLVILVTVIGAFLSGLNLVREKEMGTIEQINVTPIQKIHFLAGKLIPFWIIALFDLGLGLFIGKLLFNIPMVGSIFLLFGVAGIYLIAVLGLGLLLSTIAHTQQQAMLLSFFFMLIFIMMSGVFTSVETMPKWAQYMNIINPISYFMSIIRMILLKGSGLKDILGQVIHLLIYGIIILSLAILRYRKVAA
ncbi:MAG TPA: ABC transporter permease [Bacteroidales bacterium]|nr:ABC transporter permease [Bacteroidales bacterium]